MRIIPTNKNTNTNRQIATGSEILVKKNSVKLKNKIPAPKTRVILAAENLRFNEMAPSVSKAENHSIKPVLRMTTLAAIEPIANT